MTERQKDMTYGVLVVVFGGLILYLSTEVIFPRIKKRSEDIDPMVQLLVFLSLVIIVVLIFVFRQRKGDPLKSRWTLRSGDHQYHKVFMKRGELLLGNMEEEGGADFDVFIMSGKQALSYLEGDRTTGSQREYLGKGRYNIKWTAPRDDTFYLVCDIYQRHNKRTILLDLHIEAPNRSDFQLSDQEKKVLRAVKRVKRGTISEISKRSSLSMGTTSKYLHKLRRRGLVEQIVSGSQKYWTLRK